MSLHRPSNLTLHVENPVFKLSKVAADAASIVEPPFYRTSQADSPIRESWRALPGWSQSWLTSLSGKPLQGESPRPNSPWVELMTANLVFFIGVGASGWAWAAGGLATMLIPIGWVMTIHGLRKNDLGSFHQAAHGVFSTSKVINDAVGELLGVIHLGVNFRSYRRAHLRDHHGGNFATLADETFSFLIGTVGLRPGMSRRRAWFQLMVCLLSPAFHIKLMAERFFACVKGATLAHCVLLGIYLQLVAGAVYLFGWWPVLVAWGLPLTVFYNCADTLRTCAEHTFPVVDLDACDSRLVLALHTRCSFRQLPPGPKHR